MCIDYASEIKDSVKLIDLIRFYGFRPVHGRIPCPFHNGKDRNFSIKNNYYKCFVCGENGDAITFVQKYFNLDFLPAIQKINDDMRLGLPIGEKLSIQEQIESERKSEYRRNQVAERKAQREKLEKEYWEAFDEWVALDIVRRNFAPKTPEEGYSDVFDYALDHVDHAAYRLEEAEIALYKFDKAEM